MLGKKYGTDRRTDVHRTDALRLPLDAANVVKNECRFVHIGSIAVPRRACGVASGVNVP